jgi:hypothetical protein
MPSSLLFCLSTIQKLYKRNWRLHQTDKIKMPVIDASFTDHIIVDKGLKILRFLVESRTALFKSFKMV